MPKKVVLLLLAVFALAACDASAKFDQNDFDRENRLILRQLSSA